MNIKDQLEKLRYVQSYMNIQRFAMIFGKFQNKYDLDKLWTANKKGLYNFINEAPDEMIVEMANYRDTLDISFKNYIVDKPEVWLKYIYEIGDKVLSEEINVCDYEGNKMVIKINETADKILSICRLCDEIDFPRNARQEEGNKDKRLRIYDGDLISTNDEWKGKQSLIIAQLNNGYAHPQPYYRELLYTHKYGYLATDGEPNIDNDPVTFTDSMFNTDKDSNKNSMFITFCSEYRVIGNLATHFDFLKPDKKK